MAGKRRGPKGGAGRRGAIGVRPVGGEAFELVHPREIEEVELDYVEGLEMARAGEHAEAREALLYALEACAENLYVHAALGRLAMESGPNLPLARGHFGYIVELVERALPPGFRGHLPRALPANAPYFEAAEGLAACYEAMGQAGEASKLRARASRLSGG